MMDDARLSEIERMVGDWSLSSGIIRNACEDLIEEVRRLRGRIAEVEEAIQEAASGICVRCCKCHSVFVFTKGVVDVMKGLKSEYVCQPCGDAEMEGGK